MKMVKLTTTHVGGTMVIYVRPEDINQVWEITETLGGVQVNSQVWLNDKRSFHVVEMVEDIVAQVET